MTAFALPGLVGLQRYLNNFWLYRGFPPPHDPPFVKQHGSTQTFTVRSSALGGRGQSVSVFLPPGYNLHPARRYPVLYLLHGFPGRSSAFLLTARVGVVEDILVARRKIQPLILVMPSGSTGTFDDTEWANGIAPASGWETYLTRDVVHAVDARYRTIASGAARALGGLSAGGYAALNIAFHHPGEFRTIESWSGYQLADSLRSIFGGLRSRLDYNSPALQLVKVADRLRRSHTFVWFYCGRGDPLHRQNIVFARALTHARIAHTFFLVPGRHDWSLWRGNAPAALLVASAHVRHA